VEILHQLGEFFLQALPTFFIVFLFYLFLRGNLFQPLEKAMAERHARIEGTRQETEAIQASAKEKVRAYEEALKKARADVYAEQEAVRRAVLEERSSLIREMRSRANERVRATKEAMAKDVAAARAQLEQESQSLGRAIAKVVLERRPPSSPAAKGAR
jgi:F0F1-type ATP synthase membrane subunit b/b'